MTKRMTTGLFALALLLGSGCRVFPFQPAFTVNSSFDRWCDDLPCGWLLEAGDVEQVATWHERDSAARLIGPVVHLSQLLSSTAIDGACLDVRVLADFDGGGSASIELDFGDDGTVEWSHAVSSDGFTPQDIEVRMPPVFERVRMRFVKEGQADVVLAHLEGRQDTSACTGEPIVVYPGRWDTGDTGNTSGGGR